MLKLQEGRTLQMFEAEVSAALMGVNTRKLPMDEYGFINASQSLNAWLKRQGNIRPEIKGSTRYGYIFDRLRWIFKHYTTGHHYYWIVPKTLFQLIHAQQEELDALMGTGQYYKMLAKPVNKNKILKDESTKLSFKDVEYEIHIFNSGMSGFYFIHLPDQPADLVVYEAEPCRFRTLFRIPEHFQGFTGIYD